MGRSLRSRPSDGVPAANSTFSQSPHKPRYINPEFWIPTYSIEMGAEIYFSYATDDKSRFETPELTNSYLGYLFEAPDMLAQLGLFGGSLESVKEIGFLPSFIESFRETMGSDLQGVLETTRAEFAAQPDKTWEEIREELENIENPIVDVDFPAHEAEEWANLWLKLFATASFSQPEALKMVLPYGFTSIENIKENLRQLQAQASEAKDRNVLLNLYAEMG